MAADQLPQLRAPFPQRDPPADVEHGHGVNLARDGLHAHGGSSLGMLHFQIQTLHQGDLSSGARYFFHPEFVHESADQEDAATRNLDASELAFERHFSDASLGAHFGRCKSKSHPELTIAGTESQ